MFTPTILLTPRRVPKLDGIRARPPQDSDSERLRPKARSPNHSMSDDASRFGLRLVAELSETTSSHPTRKRIDRASFGRPAAAYGSRTMVTPTAEVDYAHG